MRELIPKPCPEGNDRGAGGRLGDVAPRETDILALDDSQAPPGPIFRKGFRLFAIGSQKLGRTGSRPDQLIRPKNAGLGPTPACC